MITTGNTTIYVYAELTPNPESIKFVFNKLINTKGSVEYNSIEKASSSELAKDLFTFPFIKSIFIANNFVTITKEPDVEWEDIIDSMKLFLKEYVESGKEIINFDDIKKDINYNQDEVIGEILRVLSEYVRPAVEMDGGAIEFEKFEDGVLYLQLQGSCSGCPSSSITLKQGIEVMMRRMVPQVEEIIAE